MFRTIRWRIAIPYVILILITLAGLGGYLASSQRRAYLEDLEADLFTQTRLLAHSYELTKQTGLKADEINALIYLWAEQTGARITIIGDDGTVLGDSHEDPARMDNHANRSEIIQAKETGEGSSSRFSATLGKQYLYTAVSIQPQPGKSTVIRLGLPINEALSQVEDLQGRFARTTILAFIFAVLLAIWVASITTRPVRQLTEAVTHLASGELASEQTPESIAPTNLLEVGLLAQAFNLISSNLRSQTSALDTERKKTASVLSEMNDGAVIVDHLGQIQMINRSAEMLFSIKFENAVGRSIAEALRHHQVVDLWQRCRDSGEPQSMLIEIPTNRLYLQGRATLLNTLPPGSILLLFQNLTRQRYLETVRRDFVSNISHELRTPLASLKALTETLQSGALDDPPAAQRFLERMETEVDALTQMVAELLELSQIESEKVPIQFGRTRPQDVVYPAVERLRLQAERARINLQIDCPNNLPPIWADPKRLEQVMVNLLHNAIKFTNPGGEIIVRAFANPEDENLAKTVTFSVSDTGIGIPADELPRIFERFYKIDRARSGSGTGLGLAIARHMVEAHQGRIWVESIAGKGSTFYFSIPIQKTT